MDRAKLEETNVGENLDTLMNLDPRGYGVCRILYKGSREVMGEPLTTAAARAICDTVKEGDSVLILTGFVLLPHKVPEMDGLVSSLLLCRTLVGAFNAKPFIVCPEDCKEALKSSACTVGLHVYEDIDKALELPLSMGVITYTKDVETAPTQALDIMERLHPTAAISIEAPGANMYGHYHNAVGMDVSDLEAKTDVLWNMIREQHILTVSIGDLGNEIGMGKMRDHICKYVPYTGIGECQCGCGGGIVAVTSCDYLITATCSDWGCYGMMAAIAYMRHDISIFYKEDMEEEVMRSAARSGMIDMTGSLLPGIDGFDVKMNKTIVSLMRQCTAYALYRAGQSAHWYAPVLEKGFFQ